MPGPTVLIVFRSNTKKCHSQSKRIELLLKIKMKREKLFWVNVWKIQYLTCQNFRGKLTTLIKKWILWKWNFTKTNYIEMFPRRLKTKKLSSGCNFFKFLISCWFLELAVEISLRYGCLAAALGMEISLKGKLWEALLIKIYILPFKTKVYFSKKKKKKKQRKKWITNHKKTFARFFSFSFVGGRGTKLQGIFLV